MNYMASLNKGSSLTNSVLSANLKDAMSHKNKGNTVI